MSEVIVNALSVYEKDLSSYRELLEVANLAPNTVKNYMDYVGRFANWLIDTQNSMPLQDVTSRIVREYILHLEGQYHQSACRRDSLSLRRSFQYHMEPQSGSSPQVSEDLRKGSHHK